MTLVTIWGMWTKIKNEIGVIRRESKSDEVLFQETREVTRKQRKERAKSGTKQKYEWRS